MAFDPDKHHIGLGPVGETQEGFVLERGYRCDPQKANVAGEFGGNTDLFAPSSFSRWTMDDFGGGILQEFWGTDNARFWASRNLLPAQLGRSARTVPPLAYWGEASSDALDEAIGVFQTDTQKIATVFEERTDFFSLVDGTRTSIPTDTNTVRVAAQDLGDNYIYAVTGPAGENAFDTPWTLRRYTSGSGTPDVVSAAPATVLGVPRGLEMGATDLLAAFANTLWLIDLADDRASATWTRIGRLPGQWADSLTYNSLTYILCVTDIEDWTSVVTYDGASILTLARLPFNFRGECIAEYGGRIYIGGTSRDVAGTAQYAELYELTGSSLRLIYSYAESHRNGKSVPTTFYDMSVHEGFLFIGTDQGYLLAYEQSRDALWQACEVRPKVAGRTMQVRNLLSAKQRLYAWCSEEDADDSDGFYRLVTANSELHGMFGGYSGMLETSDFAPEPDLNKRWASIRILTRGGGATCEWSTDGGETWETVTGQAEFNGPLRVTTFPLNGVSPSARFRFTLPRLDITSTYVLGFTVEFLTLDTGKRSFSFSLNLSDQIEGQDDSTVDQAVGSLRSKLWDWKTTGETLTYTDPDGSTYTVYLADLREDQPFVAPPVEGESGTPREAFYTVSLMEV